MTNKPYGVPAMSDSEYLEMFKISPKKYLIGIFQDGITVHKQQVRALNIFHALYKTELKQHLNNPIYTIGIIGGGVAGLTFAAAALKAGLKVTLFEQHPIYLHMQTGCDIRKVHPNLYDWPEPGYNNPYAEIPILDWKYDSASDVVRQIIRGWEVIKKEITTKNKKGFKYLTEQLSCDIKDIKEVTWSDSRERFLVNFTSDVVGAEFCDLLIFATGYGIEKGVNEEAHTPSYWRNDSYAQTDLEASPKTYLISGVGDGGLIDLFRLKIFGFDYELILEIIEKNENYAKLLPKLLEIKSQLLIEEDKGGDVMYQKFCALDQDYYNYIYETIRSRELFRKGPVWLNDIQPEFQYTLNHKRLSFLHAFLCYILIWNGKKINLTYKGGELNWDKDKSVYLLNGTELPANSKVILRHGTNRMDSIPVNYFNATIDQTMENIRTNQMKDHHKSEVQRRWSNSELISIFDPGSTKRYEYLNSATSVLCTNYISGLSNLIKNKTDKEFRVTLHRLIYIQGAYYFQQITSYFGTKETVKNESYGQVFNITRGNVGLTFRTGRPYLMINREEDAFKELVTELNLLADYEKTAKNQTFLTFPILAPTSKSSSPVTNLVLFLDSPHNDFFPGQIIDSAADELFTLITAATQGFIQSVKHHLQFEEITMIVDDFDPMETMPVANIITENICIQDIATSLKEFEPNNTVLKFDSFHSFTIIK